MTSHVRYGSLGAMIVLLAGACSGSSGERVTTRVIESCTPGTLCSGCTSCLEACLCDGGARARCARTCLPDAGAPRAKSPDAEPPPDAGEPVRDLPSTYVADGFDVPPGGESFRCQNFSNPYGRDVAVTSSQSFMTVGSHHMFLFLQDGIEDAPLTPCSGLSFGTYLHSTQQSEARVDYPKGVGRLLPGHDGLQIMVHYLNTSADPIRASVAVTVHATDPSHVPIHASQIFANTAFLNVPARSKATVRHSCGVPRDVNVFNAVSHMHSHGVHFVARSSDGQLLYETNQWAEPEPWTFSPPRRLGAGSTIDVTCDYDNTSDQNLSFGESAATNEMCIFVGAYYPAIDGEEIDCLF